MSFDVYTFGTDGAAHLTDPPEQWLLKGPNDQDPWVVEYWNSVTKEILDHLQPLHGMYDSAGPGFQANKISPWGYPTQSDPVATDGVYLSDWTTYGVKLQASSSRSIILLVDSGHSWTWSADGYLDILAYTKGAKGLRAAKDSLTDLRYGYDNSAYPTFRYNFSPRNGGWSVTIPTEGYYAPNSVAHTEKASLTGTGVGPYDVAARIPLQLPHDTSRSSFKVAFTAKGLHVGGLHLAGVATTTTVAFKARSRSTGSVTDVFSVTSTSTTSADFSDTSTGIGDLDTSAYEYFLEWSVGDASLLDGAYVGYVYLDIEKRAVE